MQNFKGPKPNFVVSELCKFILPFWLRFKEQLSIKVQGSKADLDAFSKNHRAVIMLNHPGRQDPFVICELSKRLHEPFYCIAARECFDWDNGWRGWLFQSLGCYSVVRGKADFHSVATTKKILMEGRRKLVVFPEAEITADDNKLHELHRAIFHIILEAQESLLEKMSSNSEKPLLIIPAAIQFSLKSNLDSAVKPSLRFIEEHLGLKTNTSLTVLSRVDAVVEAYLSRVCDSYGIAKSQGSLEKLAEHAAVEIIRTIASKIGVESDESLSATERLYAIRNKAAGQTQINSVAVHPDAFHCLGMASPGLLSDFERIERLLVMEKMLRHESSDIQCCRILDFIECELSGSITPKGWQSCVVTLGTPIDVSKFVPLYIESKDKGVNDLSEHFRQKLQSMLLENHVSCAVLG